MERNMAMPMPSANDDRLAGAMHALTFRFIPRLLQHSVMACTAGEVPVHPKTASAFCHGLCCFAFARHLFIKNVKHGVGRHGRHL